MNRSIALMVISAGMAASIASASVVIDFDTFPGGAPVPAGTIITSQYSSVGVIFSSPATAGGAQALANGEASSGRNFLVGLDSIGGAGLYPISMDFTSGLASTVNLTLISVGCSTVTASAYASDLTTILSTVSVTNGLGAGVGFGNHNPISLTMGSGGGIARITFSIAQTGPVIDGFGIDDIDFTPVPTPGAAVVLGLAGVIASSRRRSLQT
jgi:hypothetical protein